MHITKVKNMKKILSIFAFLPSLAMAQVELKTEMFEVVEVQKENGKSKIEWVKPDNIIPGDKVGYRISFVNNGKDAADNIVLNNPVPENTVYVDGSARGAKSQILYSVNGGQKFGQPSELFVEKDGKTLPAQAKDYTNVRWVLTQALQAKESGSVQYVVQVK